MERRLRRTPQAGKRSGSRRNWKSMVIFWKPHFFFFLGGGRAHKINWKSLNVFCFCGGEGVKK